MPERTEHGCTRPEIGDLLGAYELGLLETADRQRFETHLEDCAACLEDLYQGAPAAETLRADPGRFKAVLDDAAAGPSPAVRLGRFLSRLLRPRVLAPLGAVAAVALALLVLLPDGMVPSARLAVIDPLPWEGLDLRGGPDRQADRLLAEGMQQYAAGNYEGAAAALGSAYAAAGADEAWTDRDQTALFLGLSLLLDDRPTEATTALETAAISPLLPIAERGRWYLAQAHLLRGEPQAALTLLESLLNSPVYADRAATQLQSVREICDNPDGS